MRQNNTKVCLFSTNKENYFMPKKQVVLLVINIILLVAMLVMAVLFCVYFVDFLVQFYKPIDPDTPNAVGLYILVFIYCGIIALPISVVSLVFALVNRKLNKKRGNVLLTLTLALFALMLAIFVIVYLMLV